MKKKLSKLVLNDVEQKDINRSLSFMRNSERLSDLRFICKDNVSINAHSELFRQASPFMVALLDITKEKQPYETTCISLDETDGKIVTKLVQAMYLGRTTVTKKEELELQDVIKQLGLKMPLNAKEESDEEDSIPELEPEKKIEERPQSLDQYVKKKKGKLTEKSGEDSEPVKKTPNKPGPRSKNRSKPTSSGDESSDSPPLPKKKSAKTGGKDDDKLRQEAEKDVVKPKLFRLEKSDEADVKKYFKRDPSNDKKSNKPNSAPSSSREQSPAPQKLAPNPFSKAKKKEETQPASPTPEKLVPNPFSSDKKKTTLTPATAASTTPVPQKMVANPFHKGSAVKSTPQKRRLADSDKKVVNKASKKPRQESSTSGDDSALEEAKKARSKEIPASAKSPPKSRARKSSESSSVDDAKVQKKANKSDSDSDIKKKPKPTPTAKKTPKAGSASEKSRDSSPAAPAPAPKRKPGPKSKPRPGPANSAKKDQKKPIEAKSAVNSMAFTEGDSITCCDDCDKIFLSRQAYLNHRNEFHVTKASSVSEKSDGDSEPVKKTPNKPGPRTKKSKAKITEERRKSNRSSSSSSENEEAKVEKSKSARRPGPKSKLVKTDNTDSDSDIKKKPKTTPTAKKTPKAGPASKIKKNGSVNKKLQPPTGSDSDSNSGKKDDSNSDKKSSAKSSTSAKKPDRRDSISTGQLKCRFCISGHENALGLKNHVLNHFKDQLNKHLPSCTPFLCPECKNPQRDKITCLRHYAFGHKKVFDLVDQEDFKARPKDHPIKSVPTGGKINTGAVNPFSAKKTKKLPEEVLPELSDSDSNVPKKKPVKENDDLVTKSFSKEPEVETSKPDKVHFSSSDEDDWSKIANSTKETIKSFDDLFNDNKNDDNSDKKAKDSAAEDKEKENDDGKESENGDLNFETSKRPDSEWGF